MVRGVKILKLWYFSILDSKILFIESTVAQMQNKDYNNYSYRKYFFHPFHHENIPEKCLVICYFNSTLKDINQNFTCYRSNEKNSRTLLPEKANFWTFDPFNDFFGNLKLVKVRNAHPKVTVLCGQFYHEAHIICSWNLLVCS